MAFQQNPRGYPTLAEAQMHQRKVEEACDALNKAATEAAERGVRTEFEVRYKDTVAGAAQVVSASVTVNPALLVIDAYDMSAEFRR